MYYVTITTANGCIIMDSVFIQVDPTLPNPQITPSTTICQGSSIQLNASGANSYVWNPPTGLSNPNIANPIASPTSTITYVVDFANGCGIVQDSVTIAVIEAEATAIEDQWMCPGDSVLLWGAGGVSYNWSPMGSLSHPDSNVTWAMPGQDQTYTVVITDAFGCVDSTTVNVMLYPVPYVNAGPDRVITFGSSTQLDADGFGAFVWDTVETLSCSACEMPEAEPTQTTTYWVTITDENGCTNRDDVTVFVDGSLYVPNTFTPNEDGKNDFFFARGEEIQTFHLMIFDRWGELIFQSYNIDTGWDGNYKGEPAQIDTYVWKIQYSESSGKKALVYGHVNLVR